MDKTTLLPTCEHKNTTPRWESVTCDDCGAFYPTHKYGHANRIWFDSESAATFYRDFGRLPENTRPQPQVTRSAEVETALLELAAKEYGEGSWPGILRRYIAQLEAQGSSRWQPIDDEAKRPFTQVICKTAHDTDTYLSRWHAGRWWYVTNLDWKLYPKKQQPVAYQPMPAAAPKGGA